MFFLWMLLACTPDSGPGHGPTMGGDVEGSSEVVSVLQSKAIPVGEFTESGVVAALPFSSRYAPCDKALCLTPHAAELPNGTWLVSIGLDGAAAAQKTISNPELDDTKSDLPRPVMRAHADVVFSLDLSDSVESSTDVRSAVVEIGVDHLGAFDTVGLVGFRDQAAVLLARRQADGLTRTLVSEALVATESLQAVSATRSYILHLLPDQDLCEADPGEVKDEVLGCLSTTFNMCGRPWDGLVAEDLEEELNLLDKMIDWSESENTDLLPAVQMLTCSSGTEVKEGVAAGLSQLPSRGTDRAARLVLVSDMDGGEEAIPLVEAAAEQFVGLTLMGITKSMDSMSARSLAVTPGGVWLDASDPSEALTTWDLRFEHLLAPTAWSLSFELTRASRKQWEITGTFGATDLAQSGANAVFASADHGAVGLMVKSRGEDPPPLWLIASYELPQGEVRRPVSWLNPGPPGSVGRDSSTGNLCFESASVALRPRIYVLPPMAPIDVGFAAADNRPALSLAARRVLHQALNEASESQSRGPLNSVLPSLREYALIWDDPSLQEALGLVKPEPPAEFDLFRQKCERCGP
jgi:hypothetical protein